jgi:hypothetical protein
LIVLRSVRHFGSPLCPHQRSFLPVAPQTTVDPFDHDRLCAGCQVGRKPLETARTFRNDRQSVFPAAVLQVAYNALLPLLVKVQANRVMYPR